MKILQSWRSLNHALNLKSEAEVLELLEYERSHERRLSVLQRLHQRYNSLRVARERIEILKEARSV